MTTTHRFNGDLNNTQRGQTAVFSRSPMRIRPRNPNASSMLQKRVRNVSIFATLSETSDNKKDDFDVVIIGSGIGGLSCASLLARYGLNVLVCESHDVCGGAAHAFQRNDYHFESGPSLYSGMASRGPSANPLSLVLQAIEEPLELLKYDVWNVYLPETPLGFPAGVGPEGFHALLQAASQGDDVLDQWHRLQNKIAPLSQAAAALPPAAIRLDFGVIQSAIVRFLPSLLKSAAVLPKMTAPFSRIMDEANITDPFLRNYMDLLCFLLSGLPANGTITAEVAFMMKEWCDPGAILEFPKGGSDAMVNALLRGVKKYGGTVRNRTHVKKVLVENDKAVGIELQNGEIIRAKKAVVSNASSFDTLRLLPESPSIDLWGKTVQNTPLNPSFMHLHLGFDATGLEDLDLHHIIVDDWSKGVTGQQNVVLISIPSVIDPSLAPSNKHSLHAYYPATEPWDLWQGIERNTEEYRQLKEERAKPLWAAVERVIPDIKKRVEISLVGTPLTHARYLRRHNGSYGPAWKAGKDTFPFGTTPVQGLYCCGDFCFPGIGLPAVAAGGAIVANTLVPLKKHLELLDSIGL